MKRLWCLLLLLPFALPAHANSQRLHLVGRVTEKVEVQAERGRLLVSHNSPQLKITVENRMPASLVKVEAP